MAEGHQAGVVVADALDRPRPQPPDQTGEAVFAADVGRPAVQVAAETHSCGKGEIVAAPSLTLDHLDESRHALVVVLESPTASIKKGVGPERAGVGAGDRPGQGLQVLLGSALVGAEVAVILPGEGGPQAVFELAGRTHD